MDGGLVAVRATFSRCVSRKRDPLSTEGARLMGGRFNPRGCGALYLAGSPTVAVAEHLRLGSIFEMTAFNPRLLVSIDVSLSVVLDLTDPEVVHRLGLADDDLLGNWESETDAPPQVLGNDARDRGVEGILFPSRLEQGVANLCVFRENERADSYLTVNGFDDVLTTE